MQLLADVMQPNLFTKVEAQALALFEQRMRRLQPDYALTHRDRGELLGLMRSGGGATQLVDRAFRLAERIVQHAHPVQHAASGEVGSWVVHQRGDWFRTAGNNCVDCRRRPATRRLLRHFVKRYLEAPGEVVQADELIAAVWRGEKMAATAAMNRLKVLVSRLRSLGWRPALESYDGGWRIAPSARLRIVHEPAIVPIARTGSQLLASA